ncbi:hypothetical protein F5Y19DRAFT_476809 [Xylariaceae sp. FL1651]|nr:hypothetical protein F5Y19DRAFT_476809 [Xylariaceae sp. FL1651]
MTPKFLTYSQYDFNGIPHDKEDPKAEAFIRASEARAQQVDLAARSQSGIPYAGRFKNIEELPLTTPGSATGPNGESKWDYQPLKPRTSKARSRADGPRGAVRSIYTPGNPTSFDVAYHDPRAGTSPGGFDNFSLAKHHPKS